MEVKYEKFNSEDTSMTPANRKVKRESKLKETQEEDNAFPCESIFCTKLEKLVSSIADPSKEATSTVKLESSTNNDLHNEDDNCE